MNGAKDTTASYRIGLLLSRARSRVALPYVVTACVVLAAILLGGEEIERHIAAVEPWIAALGPWGLLAFVVLFALATSLLLPDTVLCIVAGALFGIGWGFATVLAGSVLGGATQFLLAHKLLRARVDRVLASRPSLAAIQRAVRHDEFKLQVLLRLTPLNPATVSYLLGATGVRFTGFLVASLATAPNLLAEVYFGHIGKHAVRTVGRAQGWSPQDVVLFGGLVVCILVVGFVSRLARKALMQAVADVAPNELR